MLKFFNKHILLIGIIILASFFRLYGLNWDQGYHLHPDERAIVMFSLPLEFPENWDPHFFAYGSLPLYLLKIVGNAASIFDPLFATYEKINLVGRLLSALFDIGTLFMVFLIGKKLFNKTAALIASFFYSIAVLPIQLSHFYAVDTPLTFFICVTLWWLMRLYEQPSKKHAVFVGLFFGLALATKVSATVLIASIGTALAIDFLLIFFKTPHKPHIWFPHIPKFLKRLFTDGVIIVFITCITFIIVEPYALIDFGEFWRQTVQQRQMTYDAFAFPYTLQYVGKIPYIYELKNIFFWGLGPILATLSFLGTIYISFFFLRITPRRSHSVTPPRWPNGFLGGGLLRRQALILLSFFWVYFFVVGNFSIGFMRYMLPLYPFLCLFAAVFVWKLFSIFNFKFSIKSQKLNFENFNIKNSFKISNLKFVIGLLVVLVYIGSILVWPIAFMHIYAQPNTRILATQWINENIPSGSTLAVEHWDDSLPLTNQYDFNMVTLPLYDPDTPLKWQSINQTFSQTDYIIIASNRLYTPLQKLTDCEHLPTGRCYTQTANYYKELFNGSLGFQKIAEFAVYPSLIINHLSFVVDDSSADESFTVYDHPKILIFKKMVQ